MFVVKVKENFMHKIDPIKGRLRRSPNRYFEIADGLRKLVVLLLEIYRIPGHGTWSGLNIPFYETRDLYFTELIARIFFQVFFVLRKKNNHVSTLHVIHHGCMPMSVWFGVKFTPGR